MVKGLFYSDALHQMLFLPQCNVSTFIIWFCPSIGLERGGCYCPLAHKGRRAESPSGLPRVSSWMWTCHSDPCHRAWPGPFLTPFGLAGYGFLDFGSKRRGKAGGISKLVPFGFSWRLRRQLWNSPFDCDVMAFDLDSWLNRDMLIIFPCFSELVWFSSLERKPCNISPFESSGCKCSCNIIV